MNQEFDTNQAIKEADQYVRDHLLIEFMLDFLKFSQTKDDQIENVYHCWIDWLKEREEFYAKGSKV